MYLQALFAVSCTLEMTQRAARLEPKGSADLQQLL
jgi:hypothetical protein